VALLASKLQTGVAPLGRYITAHGSSLASLFNAVRAIFGPSGKIPINTFSNEKAW